MPAIVEVGREADRWVWWALECVPEHVWSRVGDRLSIMSMATSDGRRLTPKFTQGRHVIVVSERIIPHGAVAEDHGLARYLMFVVLHEVAHASCDHQPPNEVSAEGNQQQENEANALAFDWFNAHLDERIAQGAPLSRYTHDELAKVMAAVQQPDRACAVHPCLASCFVVSLHRSKLCGGKSALVAIDHVGVSCTHPDAVVEAPSLIRGHIRVVSAAASTLGCTTDMRSLPDHVHGSWRLRTRPDSQHITRREGAMPTGALGEYGLGLLAELVTLCHSMPKDQPCAGHVQSR